MSRYQHEHKGMVVVYGYDRPMMEYFIQVIDPKIEDEDAQMVIWEGSYMTSCSNGRMLELFDQWGVPMDHKNQLLMDLPF